MIRVAIVVEGQTEEEFGKLVLAPHLERKDVFPILRLPGAQGGNITVGRIAEEVRRLLPNFDYVTSLLDFYGFQNRPPGGPNDVEEAILHEVNVQGSGQMDQSRLFPYVQMHEFEALLFSDVAPFAEVLESPQESVVELQRIRSSFSTPEDINDNFDTAPSRRIKTLIPEYQKVAHGPLLAERIGLPTIRSECPRFNRWVTQLESLA